MDKVMLQYYQEFDEHNRIIGDSIERLRTQELISRFLCGDSLQILDVGGASIFVAAVSRYSSMIDGFRKCPANPTFRRFKNHAILAA